MSTRSLIGIKDDRGITYVYCHFDGYLAGVGTTLLENYKTEDVVNELVDGGDMSSVGETIKTCAFYADRGEDGTEARTIPADTADIKDVYYECGQNCWADYVYLFEDGKWYYSRESVKRTEDGHGIVYDDKGELVYAPAEWKSVADGVREGA